MQDSDIRLSENTTVLLSSILLLDDSALPVHHNVHTTMPGPMCHVFKASTQTYITPALSVCQQTLVPTLKAESILTDPPIHRKNKDCYHRIQTLPILTPNAAT